jgi:catechol 2,3-dioxygenase-like lactoylglutathione lyase family enzyme
MADEFVAQYDANVSHVALRAHDLPAMRHFYQDLIGLPFRRLQGSPENPEVVWLAGVQLIRQDEPIAMAAGAAYDHVGLGIDNIEEACQRLDAAGTPVDTPLEKRHVEVLGRDILVAFYRDPEGNRIELLKYL